MANLKSKIFTKSRAKTRLLKKDRFKTQGTFMTTTPMPSSLTAKYASFLELYRHQFGNKGSPYRERTESWLRSLKKGDDFHTCQGCLAGRHRKCDRDKLSCTPCLRQHQSCSRIRDHRKIIIMDLLNLTEADYDKLSGLTPSHKGSRVIQQKLKKSKEEKKGENEEEEIIPKSDEMMDQLGESDSEDGRTEQSSARSRASSYSSHSSSSSLPLLHTTLKAKKAVKPNGVGRARPRSSSQQFHQHTPTDTCSTPQENGGSDIGLVLKTIQFIQHAMEELHGVTQDIRSAIYRLAESTGNENQYPTSIEVNHGSEYLPASDISMQRAHLDPNISRVLGPPVDFFTMKSNMLQKLTQSEFPTIMNIPTATGDVYSVANLADITQSNSPVVASNERNDERSMMSPSNHPHILTSFTRKTTTSSSVPESQPGKP